MTIDPAEFQEYLISDHPFDTLVRACAPLQINPLHRLRIGAPVGEYGPADERWYRADELADARTVAELIARLQQVHGPPHSAPAAVRFLKGLARDAIYVVAGAVYLADMSPDIAPTNLYVRWGADSRFDGIAFGAATIAPVRPPSHPDLVSLTSIDALDHWAAHRLVASFAPLIDAIRAHTRVGPRLLWGYLSDIVHFRMLMAARDTGRDREIAWERAERFTDALILAGAPIRSRPRLVTVDVTVDDKPEKLLWAVRGVCCLAYRADREHGYCTTCPRQPDGVRIGAECR